jgi:hypothetical protein
LIAFFQLGGRKKDGGENGVELKKTKTTEK